MANVTIEPDFSLSIENDDFRQSPNGIACTFLQIGNTGLKLYRSKRSRDLSYSNQLKLSEWGVAPTVGMKTEVMVKSAMGDRTYYAFETEIVECADRRHHNGLCNDTSPEGYATSQAYIKPFRNALCELRAALEGCPEYVNWIDDHTFNVGITSDGRPVLIDCADNLFGNGNVNAVIPD